TARDLPLRVPAGHASGHAHQGLLHRGPGRRALPLHLAQRRRPRRPGRGGPGGPQRPEPERLLHALGGLAPAGALGELHLRRQEPGGDHHVLGHAQGQRAPQVGSGAGERGGCSGQKRPAPVQRQRNAAADHHVDDRLRLYARGVPSAVQQPQVRTVPERHAVHPSAGTRGVRLLPVQGLQRLRRGPQQARLPHRQAAAQVRRQVPRPRREAGREGKAGVHGHGRPPHCRVLVQEQRPRPGQKQVQGVHGGQSERVQCHVHPGRVHRDRGGLGHLQLHGQEPLRLRRDQHAAARPGGAGSPVNVTVANATGNSLLLSWAEPFRGNSAITRYLVQFREAGSDDEAALRNLTTNTSLTLASIGSLRPARVFSLRVKAENGVGWGRFSGWVTANTEEDSPASPPVNITARPTGPNSIKISWEPPKEEDWNGHLKGYYISYRPVGSSDQYYHKTVDVHNPHQRQEIHLTNLRLSMSYSVTIQAFTSKGAGPMSQEVLVKTLDDVPPSPPTLEVVSVTTSSVTLGWSLKTSFGNPVTEYVLHQRKDSDHWQETPISTVQPLHMVRDLECGTTYQFYMTAHNSLGRSEPSDVIRAKTDGAAPLSPSKEEFIQASQRHATLSLRSWKSGGCELLDFSVRLRQGGPPQAWANLAEGLPANQSQFLLRNLTPGATYHVHVVAKSTAGATEAQYEFATLNGTTHVASVEATSTQPKRSTLPSMTDLEIIVPILVSSFVVLVVIIVGCILCSRESLCTERDNCARPELRSNYSEEVVAMKELANAAECMARCEDGLHAPQMGSPFPTAQSIYAQRPETEDDPYAMPYDVLHRNGAEEGDAGCQNHLERNTLKRRPEPKEHRSNNIYISRQSLTRTKPRERPYESLMVNMNPYPADGTTTSTLSRKEHEDVQVALLTALVQCQLCGSGNQPSPQKAANRMTKSQLELAKELLRIFNLQHVLTPSNASQRVELNYPNGTRSFVPSNPYWILMNKTLRVSDNHHFEHNPLHPKPPDATSTTSSNLIPKDSEEAFIMGPQLPQERASRILSDVKAATTSAQPVYMPSPGHRIIQRADLRQNTTLFRPPLMQRFTFEDAPKSRPLWYTLQQESMTKKIEQAKLMASQSVSVNHSRTGVRSDEVDLDPSASSDLKFQPAMRIITSPANSIKHQLPATYNHAFVVLGQPAGKGRALTSELSRSEDTFPNVIFAAEISRGPVSSISPFDTAPIGSTKRVMTIYGKTTNQKPAQPTRGYPPDREYPPRKDYPRQDYSSGSRRPPGESGKAQGPTGDDEDDPSRFDEFAAWKQLTRPPIAGGFPASFMPMGFGYPPFRGPQFGGGGGGGLGQGIGTILPVKKPKFKLLLGKGTFRSPLSLFGGGQQGWYCPVQLLSTGWALCDDGFPRFLG
ncbi:hypothetical protein HPB47_006732, partial [Ixodes persulcatus]